LFQSRVWAEVTASAEDRHRIQYMRFIVDIKARSRGPRPLHYPLADDFLSVSAAVRD